MRSFTAAALLAATLAIAAPARAEEHVWRVGNDLLVKAGDLDLSTADDRQALLRRVQSAAQRLCRGHSPQTRRIACAEEQTFAAVAHATPALQQAYRRALEERDARVLAAQ